MIPRAVISKNWRSAIDNVVSETRNIGKVQKRGHMVTGPVSFPELALVKSQETWSQGMLDSVVYRTRYVRKVKKTWS